MPESFPVEMPPASVPRTGMISRSVLTVDADHFEKLSQMRELVVQAEAESNSAKAVAKEKKDAFDAARGAFEREWDRFVKRAHGEDLPLFAQNDLIDQANSDPIVRGLVELLVDCGFDDVNALVVNGWTEEERNAARGYLEVVKFNNSRTLESTEEARDLPPLPAFLAGDGPALVVDQTSDDAADLEQGNVNPVQAAVDIETGRKKKRRKSIGEAVPS